MTDPDSQAPPAADRSPETGTAAAAETTAEAESGAAIRSVELGDLDPSGSRHRGRRSAVLIDGGTVYVGIADGTLVAVDPDGLGERWRAGERADDAGAIVSLAALDGLVIAGERGDRGAIRAHDAATGERLWRHDAVDDVGAAQRETRFYYPFVVDLVADRDADRAFAAARRYERRDGGPRFESVVYALDAEGAVEWRREADASPIALDRRDDRLAVAYNRCPGEHRDGLAVLDPATGAERWRFDPEGDGDRRAGDVALLPEGALLASHADCRGYRLDGDGRVAWRVDLGRPTERGGEVVYAYPNHVHATPAGGVFLTGNTYPEEGRETAARHPNEHRAIGVDPGLDSGGRRRWAAELDGFVTRPAAAGDTLAVPIAQHFRDRDPGVHGVRTIGVADGTGDRLGTAGVATAAALADGAPADEARADGAQARGTLAAIEEPVRYHDEGAVRGDYRLHVTTVADD